MKEGKRKQNEWNKNIRKERKKELIKINEKIGKKRKEEWEMNMLEERKKHGKKETKKLGGRKYEYRKEKERIKNVYAERKWMNEKR